jgi:predicted ATPase
LTQEWAETAITSSTEQGFPFFEAWGAGLSGWVLAKRGQEKEGIAQIRKSLGTLQTIGAEVIREWFLILLAEAYGNAGQMSQGLKELAAALSTIQEEGGHFHEAELYRLKGELTLRSGVESIEYRVKEAEECFLKAIETARKQQAKSLELRATISLVRLWQQQGKWKEAHQVLSEIYDWFTEGFDTKDLQEAKALLEELT